jgi:hypothetical protein
VGKRDTTATYHKENDIRRTPDVGHLHSSPPVGQHDNCTTPNTYVNANSSDFLSFNLKIRVKAKGAAVANNKRTDQ